MAEFLSWSHAARQILTFLIALSVLSQTLLIIFSFRRYPRNYKYMLGSTLEVFVLLGILVYSLMHGQALHSYFSGIIAPLGYEVLRLIAFVLISMTSFLVVILTWRVWPLTIVLLFLPLLPSMERILDAGFAYLIFASIVILLTRGISLSLLRAKEIGCSISASSIKNTVDSLHTGVLFCESDGFILLINEQMQRLMKTISGGLYRNGKQFYNYLAASEVKSEYRRVEFEGQIVFLLPDNTAWMFTNSVLEIKGKYYSQLAATDITQQWLLTEKLQKQEKELTIKSAQLRESIVNLQVLNREREMQKAKRRAHDVLGQRLSLLLRNIRSDEALDYDLFLSLSQGILDELRKDKISLSPKKELDGLQRTFATIGIKISVLGDLPSDHEKSRIIIDIIRESVTNAVRHGFASEISVVIADIDDRLHLKISNNGDVPSQPIIEGGGLAAIRKMVEPYGGEINVDVEPSFALSVHVRE